MLSLALLVICHILFMFAGRRVGCGGELERDGVESWKLAMMAVVLVLYQNLDNIDGKQARLTSTPTYPTHLLHYIDSSSPLGMMFDHGVDSLASFMISLQMLQIL